MTTHFRVLRAMVLSAALSVPGASIALADSPASLQAGSPAQSTDIERPVVPNNGLCGAQYGVPMANCDAPRSNAVAPGGVDYQGFPYNLPSD